MINFDSTFKVFDYKQSFDLKSSFWLAYHKAGSRCLNDVNVEWQTERYREIICRMVYEVKAANQRKVTILQVDLKKYNIQPPDYILRVLAQALYLDYGIELKQVDQLSQPNAMTVCWNRDNPLFNTSSNQFQNFRQQGFLVDYRIKYGEESFPVHKLVLAAKSPFFESLFGRGFKVSEEHQIPFEDVKSASVSAWLDYLYTDDVKITEEIVSDLIRFAQYYELGHLQQKCCHYLCQTVNVTNLIQFIGYGHIHELEGLEDALVASVQSTISLENLEACLKLIRDDKIKNLETVCLAQIKTRFPINYFALDETRKLLEIADQFSYPEIKVICNKKFENCGIHEPTFELLIKWFFLACEYKQLTHVSDYCTRTIPLLLEQSNDFFDQIKQLLQLADQYNLESMKEICTNLLMERVEKDHDIIFVLANKFGLDRLKQACLTFQNRND